jgi:carboxylesterase
VTLAPAAEPSYAEAVSGADRDKRVGVLLLEGFTGSPGSLRPWAAHLAAAGFHVSVPCLPGHGTTRRDLDRTTWTDWYDEAQRSFDRLLADSDEVVVGGLSTGGALSLRLAADRGREVAGLMLVNPAVSTQRRGVLALALLNRVVPSAPGLPDDIKKPGVDERGCSRPPLRAAHSMMRAWKPLRAVLPRVTQPLLMFRSVEDHVADPSSATVIRSGVSSRDLTLRMLGNSYHVATLDNDAPAIFEESTQFVRRVTGP